MLSAEEFILFVALQSAGVLAIGCAGKTRKETDWEWISTNLSLKTKYGRL